MARSTPEPAAPARGIPAWVVAGLRQQGYSAEAITAYTPEEAEAELRARWERGWCWAPTGDGAHASEEMSVYLEIDPTVNAACVTVTENDVDRTEMLDQRRRIDSDERNEVVGFEFLDISHGVDLRGLPFQSQLERLLGDHHIPIYV